MNSKQKKKLRLLLENFDIRIARTGEVIAKRGFFYRHGRDEETLAKDITAVLDYAGIKFAITHKQEHYNSWPKDSWWEVRLTISEGCWEKIL